MYLQVLEEQDYEEYIKVQPVDEFCVLGVELDKSETDMYEILIAQGIDIQVIGPVVSAYIEWLNECEKELTSYMQEQLGEELPKEWMSNIEVYSVSIVFDDVDDYGATISFAVHETLGGHIVELDFDKCEIEDSRLVG